MEKCEKCGKDMTKVRVHVSEIAKSLELELLNKDEDEPYIALEKARNDESYNRVYTIMCGHCEDGLDTIDDNDILENFEDQERIVQKVVFGILLAEKQGKI